MSERQLFSSLTDLQKVFPFETVNFGKVWSPYEDGSQGNTLHIISVRLHSFMWTWFWMKRSRVFCSEPYLIVLEEYDYDFIMMIK